jgi:uncharacterized protein
LFRSDGILYKSASDLVAHSSCHHLTSLNFEVAAGRRRVPYHADPLLEVLKERGRRHEVAYLNHLTSIGLSSIRIDGFEITDEAVRATVAAMHAALWSSHT